MLPLLPIALPVLGLAAITKFHLKGENLSKYDRPDTPVTFPRDEPSEGHAAVVKFLHESFTLPNMNGANSSGLKDKRQRFEDGGLNRDFGVSFQDDIASFGDATMSGEWTLADGAKPDKRILYLHGGAFTVGSAVSHRPITAQLAKRTGASVFAPNYRLMPENSRMDAIKDARAAYRWILHNGPDGPFEVQKLAVAGDSAGGNLTLMLSNWVRDEGLRAADAVIGLSAAIDSTFSSPSIKSNFETDLMLKPLAKPLLKTPRSLLVWAMWKQLKISPASPKISPIMTDLSNLPPTLLQVSAAEMMLDDSLRYGVKARKAGSDVTVQSWSHVPHVFQIFDRELAEADEAFTEIAKFLKAQKF